MRKAITIAIACTLGMPSPAVAQCNMSLAFHQPDERGTQQVRVWSGGDALLFGTSLNVNTDGTRRSYSVDDFWGESRAINNLCNAMIEYCEDVPRGPARRERVIVTQQAAAAGWPPPLLARTRIAPNIIVMRNGRPCPEVDGYLVSATALRRRNIRDVCDLSNYVDALTVPAIVLPQGIRPAPRRPRAPTQFQVRGAQTGDLVVAASADGSRIVYGVVGDVGPARQLGEASVAMNGALLGRTEMPENYDHVRGYHRYRGRGWGVPFAYTLIFPRSRDTTNPYMENDRIMAEARRRFEAWGGVARLTSCRTAYGRR